MPVGYQRPAASRSPFVQWARARSVAPPPRPRWSSSSTRSSARRAWVTVPATSPMIRARPARCTAIEAGSRRNAVSSTTTIDPAGGAAGRRLRAIARRRAGVPRPPRLRPGRGSIRHRRRSAPVASGARRRAGPRASGAAWPPAGLGSVPGWRARPGPLRARGLRRPGRGRSPRAARRSVRTTRRRADAARAPARVARPGDAPRSTSAKRWW